MNISSNKLKPINKYQTIIIGYGIIAGLAISLESWLYLGVLLIPLCFYLCIKKPFIFPLGLYVLLLPFDEVLSITGNTQGLTLTKLLGVLTIVLLLFLGMYEKKLQHIEKTSILWIFFLVFGITSVLWAAEPNRVINIAPTAIGLTFLYVIVAAYKVNRTEYEALKWCILIGGLIAAVFSINLYMQGSFETRTSLTFGERSSSLNRFAFTLLFPVAVCLEKVIISGKILIKSLICVVLCLILLAIVLSGSRGGMLGAGSIFIVYILTTKNKLAYLSVFIIVGVALFSLIPEFVFERWEGAIDSGGTGRIDIWFVALEALKQYWAFGAGLNNFTFVIDNFMHKYSNNLLHWGYASHNIFVGHFVELGIIGIFLFMMSLFSSYKNIRSQIVLYRVESIMLKGAFWGIIITSFFLDSLWTKSFWLLPMMIIMHKTVVTEDNNRINVHEIF